jgi:NAD-dependent DNA ligase
VFDTKYRAKFANPRNLVAGIANAKTVDDKIRDVDFVAYEVIQPEKPDPFATNGQIGVIQRHV